MRRTRIMKVGILAAMLVAQSPLASYAANGRMLPIEDDVGKGFSPLDNAPSRPYYMSERSSM